MTERPGASTLVRSPLVLVGTLLFGVGVGNSLIGQTKIAQYQTILRTVAAPAPPDSPTLFPQPSDARERRELAQAKLAFYQLLRSVGQILSALGFSLLAAGVLRHRVHAQRALANAPPAN